MTDIYWIEPDCDDARGAMEAVERQLREGRTAEPETERLLASLRAAAVLDPLALPPARPTFLGRVATSLRRRVARATWWYRLPAWGQASAFHVQAIAVIEELLARQRDLKGRLADAERRLAALEKKADR